VAGYSVFIKDLVGGRLDSETGPPNVSLRKTKSGSSLLSKDRNSLSLDLVRPLEFHCIHLRFLIIGGVFLVLGIFFFRRSEFRREGFYRLTHVLIVSLTFFSSAWSAAIWGFMLPGRRKGDRRGSGSLGGMNHSAVESVMLRASFLYRDALDCGCFQDGLHLLESGAGIVISLVRWAATVYAASDAG
jgi:hypothetical protein